MLVFVLGCLTGANLTLIFSVQQAATDVPDTIGKLVRQRRRWLNGSFFATVYAVSNWKRLMRGTSHGILRKFFFAILFGWLDNDLCEPLVTAYRVIMIFMQECYQHSVIVVHAW